MPVGLVIEVHWVVNGAIELELASVSTAGSANQRPCYRCTQLTSKPLTAGQCVGAWSPQSSYTTLVRNKGSLTRVVWKKRTYYPHVNSFYHRLLASTNETALHYRAVQECPKSAHAPHPKASCQFEAQASPELTLRVQVPNYKVSTQNHNYDS